MGDVIWRPKSGIVAFHLVFRFKFSVFVTICHVFCRKIQMWRQKNGLRFGKEMNILIFFSYCIIFAEGIIPFLYMIKAY